MNKSVPFREEEREEGRRKVNGKEGEENGRRGERETFTERWYFSEPVPIRVCGTCKE